MKKILLFLASLILSVLIAELVGKFYFYLFPQVGSFISIPANAGKFIVGIFLAYIFFLTLLFTAFGGAKKYWWIAITLIPAALFEVYFDLQHIYFPMAIGLVAWLLGRGVALFTEKK
ncbi:MAG: hypothetical protein G01um101413_246 [Parcubacteria group bacterium Gr01-1014_13]|nr:MAG: hypothetical protein G01um101413_246 [Parcubacteria group bacterium Gr01-1014_13]